MSDDDTARLRSSFRGSASIPAGGADPIQAPLLPGALLARRRRRWLAVVTLGCVALLVISGVALTVGGAAGLLEEPELAPGAQANEEPPGNTLVEPIVLEEVPDADSGGTATPFKFGDAAQTAVPAGPCDGLSADEAKRLVVTPDPLRLFAGRTKGTLSIHNCSGAWVNWTAATTLWVHLAHQSGSVGPGDVDGLAFTVDTSSLEDGSYTFKIKVSQPGYNTYVDVEGTKLGGFAIPSPTPTIGGFTADGPTGCAAKCITRALLTPMPNSANMSIEIRTKVKAKLRVVVGTESPNADPDGALTLPKESVVVSRSDFVTGWTTVLKPLQPATKYHILVTATDADGGRSFEAGTFKTPKPAIDLAANEPGGCSANCVEKATVTPTPGVPLAIVEVKAYVPVKMRLILDGAVTAGSGEEYRTEWSTKLDLDYGKTYQLTLNVTDEQGNVQRHEARLTTPPRPPRHARAVLVTFHEIHVSDDADNTFFNRRGELWFLFEVNGEHPLLGLDTDEHRIKAPATLDLAASRPGTGRGVVLLDAPDVVTIRVQGWERDGRDHTCEGGRRLFPEVSGRADPADCFEVEWNTAEGSVNVLVPPNDSGALPECFAHAGTGDFCLILRATGEDPRFEVFVTVDVLD